MTMLLRVFLFRLSWLTVAGLFLPATLSMAQPPRPADPVRLALVVGNWTYADPDDRLTSPDKDHQAIAQALVKVGFKVTREANLDKARMLSAIDRFRTSLRAAGPTAIGVLYYAGHGGAPQGVADNYLLPVDVAHVGAADTAKAGISVRDIVEQLQKMPQNRATVVIIDACRTREQPGDATPGRRPPLDLALPDEPAPGHIIAYSTRAGHPAYDNGNYAAVLAKQLAMAGLTLPQVFEETLLAVSKSARDQMPVAISALTEKVCLVSCPAVDGGTFSQNSTLLDSARHSADVAISSLAALHAEKDCVKGWQAVLALRESAVKALRDGHPDAAGATFAQIRERGNEMLEYLSIRQSYESTWAQSLRSREQQRARQLETAREHYKDLLGTLNMRMKWVAEYANRMHQPADTSKVEAMKAQAARLAAEGKVEDADDRLVDALNLIDPMLESNKYSGATVHKYRIRPRMFDMSDAKKRMDENLAMRAPVCQ